VGKIWRSQKFDKAEICRVLSKVLLMRGLLHFAKKGRGTAEAVPLYCPCDDVAQFVTVMLAVVLVLIGAEIESRPVTVRL
jgi:hypothetical protein